MGIESLEGVDKVGKYKVCQMDKLRKIYPEKFNESGSMNYQWFESEIRPNYFIYTRQDKSSVAFTIQTGPIKEVGENGVQWTALVEAALIILEGLDNKFPSRENQITRIKLQEALMWQEQRTKDREKRGVEGFDKE